MKPRCELKKATAREKVVGRRKEKSWAAVGKFVGRTKVKRSESVLGLKREWAERFTRAASTASSGAFRGKQ